MAIVDKNGELYQTRDFMRLLKPRQKKQDHKARDNEQLRSRLQHDLATEDQKHEEDKRKFINLLDEYGVDLITVAANCLEARTLHKTLRGIIDERKSSSA